MTGNKQTHNKYGQKTPQKWGLKIKRIWLIYITLVYHKCIGTKSINVINFDYILSYCGYYVNDVYRDYVILIVKELIIGAD